MADTIRKKLTDELLADLTALAAADDDLNAPARLKQEGLPDSLNDGDLLVIMADEERLDTSPAGHQDIRQAFLIGVIVALSESATTPIEQIIDARCSKVEQALLAPFQSGGDNLTYAFDAELGAREIFDPNLDGKGAWINFDIFFRHRYGDPYNQ